MLLCRFSSIVSQMGSKVNVYGGTVTWKRLGTNSLINSCSDWLENLKIIFKLQFRSELQLQEKNYLKKKKLTKEIIFF